MIRGLAVALAVWIAMPIASADPTEAPAPATKKKAKKPAAKKAPAKKAPAKKPPPEVEIEVDVAPTPAPVVAPAPEPAAPDAPVAVVAPPVHDLASPHVPRWYVRAGVARIMPLSSSRELELADVDGAASLAVQNGPVAGSGSSVDSANALAVVVGYRLGQGDRWSLETVLGVPFTVKFRATGTLADMSLAPTALGLKTGVPPLGPDLGEAKAAPPMLTVVYKVGHAGPITPFVGLGAAVLFAYDAKVTNPTLTQVSQPDFSVSPAPGIVFQGGLEAKLSRRIYARLDVKFIAGMLANAEVRHIQVATPELPLFDTVEVGTAKMSVWVNPLVVQAALGTDF